MGLMGAMRLTASGSGGYVWCRHLVKGIVESDGDLCGLGQWEKGWVVMRIGEG